MPNKYPIKEYTLIEEFGGVELVQTTTSFAVFFDIDETGEGFATDRDMSTFDTEDEARDFFAEILQR